MKCLFVINPVSGTQSFHRTLPEFIGRLVLETEVNHVDTFFTEKRSDAFNRCLEVETGEYDFVVAVGGDGTVNECLGGIIKSGSKTPVALISAGTVNDFANFLSLPSDPDGFIEMINDFHTEKIDVGMAGGKIFANVVAGGMFSDIAFQVTSEEKNRLGSLAYYLTGLSKLPEELSTNMKLTVEADGEKFEENAILFLVTNSSDVGGFRQITPKATVQDGKLDLMIIRKSGLGNLIAALHDYNFRDITENRIIRYLQAARIVIDCDQEMIYDVDGDEGSTFPVEIECLPEAVSLLTRERKAESTTHPLK